MTFVPAARYPIMYGTSSFFIPDFGFIPGSENAGAVFPAYGVPLYLPADCLLLSRNL
jgi:hypothetical protein